MKTFHLQEVHRSFYTDALIIPAKKQIAMVFDTPIGRNAFLVNVVSHRYDVSNALDVELHDDNKAHYQGKLVDLSRALLNTLERGYAIADSGFTFLVKNPFEHDTLCPRLCFQFSVGG